EHAISRIAYDCVGLSPRAPANSSISILIPGDECFGSHRLGIEEALDAMAAEIAQLFDLGYALDALGERRHAQIASQVDNGPHDVQMLFGIRHGHDEGAVDLEFVDRQADQMAERGIAGTEVVERQLETETAQLEQGFQAALP